MLLTDIGKDSLNSRETSCITMSSSYHYVKIANSAKVVFINLATKLESS